MLGDFLKTTPARRIVSLVVWSAFLLPLAWGAFTWNRDAVFAAGGIHFADGDCHARMTRVRLIEEEGLGPIRHHSWENFPDGTTPHTTMPMDALVAGLSAILSPWQPRHLELAGAWVAPLLGMATIGVLIVWGFSTGSPGWPFAPLMAAASPIVAHGFQVGRPDHQALLVLLVTIALAAEWWIWHTRRPAAGIVSAVAWGVALWVSLFEPLVLMSLVLAARLVWRREAFGIAPAVVFGAILAGALAIDGWRAAAFHPAFADWGATIGELGSAGWGVFAWCGWLLPVVPVALAVQCSRGDRWAALCLTLVVATAALSLWHARWGYFLAITFAIALPPILGGWRHRWMAGAVFLLSLWPVGTEWERILYPRGDEAIRRAEQIADAVALREAALAIKADAPAGGIIAPWWFSPAITWWSGSPSVAGTSHQSLPGILDTCRFYLASDPAEALAICARRGVSHVVSYEPARVEANSRDVLGLPPTGATTLADTLHRQPRNAPAWLEPVFANRYFKVYRVDLSADPANLTRP
jgi:hypothetical protein